MQVRATARGFYGRMIQPGEVFVLADEDHLGSWMEPTDPAVAAKHAERLGKLRSLTKAPAAPGVPLTTRSLPMPPQPKAKAKSADQPPKTDQPPKG